MRWNVMVKILQVTTGAQLRSGAEWKIAKLDDDGEILMVFRAPQASSLSGSNLLVMCFVFRAEPYLFWFKL